MMPCVIWAFQSVQVVSELGDVTAEFSVNSASGSDVSVSLAIPAVAVNPVVLNGAEYKEVALPTAEHLFAGEATDDGMPAVPVITSLLAIPDLAGVELQVEYSGFDLVDNIDLAPVQPSPLESGEGAVAFAKNDEFYARDEFYPSELATAGEPVIMRDVRMVQLAMYPVQYNPARRQLKIYHDLNIRANYTYGGDVVNPKLSRRPFVSEAFYPMYRDLISNFDDYFSTATVQRGGILIISKVTFIDTLKALANWKHRKGYTVHLAPTTEFDPDGGNLTQTQVFNYIQDAYETWEIPPEYVMIVGDEDNTSGPGIPDWPYYTSDHHYSMVDGSDYLPDVAIVRLSVDSPGDLSKVVAKIMTYETHPYMDDPGYWLRGLSVAGNVYATTPRITVLWVRQLLLEHGFTSVDTSFGWFSGDSDSRLPGLFNQGVSLVSYRGWAGPSQWYSPTFSVGNLNALQNNNKIGVMASIVCGTGDFGPGGVDPCFGETWLRMGASRTSFKGGPSFFGATDHSTHTRWNNPIMVGYYWSIIRGGNHHFGMAALRGKMQQYMTFPGDNGPGQTIELYFHTYNMLGDPELEVRAKIPIMLAVAHPDTLPLGVNFVEVSVTDTASNPIADAYVVLTKGYGDTEEVFEVGRTGAAGNISMSFRAATADTLFVTVSGKDLYPYQGHVMIVQAEVSLAPDSLIIDDDNTGYSSGNGNGIINAAERVELGVALKNFGDIGTAQGVYTTLESLTPKLATVYGNTTGFSDIAPGERALGFRPFVVDISEGAIDGDMVRLKLTVIANINQTWASVIELPVVAPRFNVSAVTFLDPGDSVAMVLTVENLGSVDAEGVAAVLMSNDDYTAVFDGVGFMGDIPAGGNVSNTGDPFVVRVDSSAFDGRNVNLQLGLATSSHSISIVPFSTTVGNVTSSDPTGPEAYGYYMFDNTDVAYPPVPTYDWEEIAPSLGGPGTRLTFTNTDDKSVMIELPFDFVYYGHHQRKIIVSTNGFVAFDTFRFDMAGNFWYNFFNWPIPDPGNGSGQISPFWDDLEYSGSNYGVIVWNDTTEHRFIIEWYHMTHANTGAAETFEMIIYDAAYHPTITGDCEFLFQYNTIQNNDYSEGYASVGFESHDELNGIQYTYHNSYSSGSATLANSRAIKITTNTGRGGISGLVTFDGGAPAVGADVVAATGQHRVTADDGSYWFRDMPLGYADLEVTMPGYFPVSLTDIYVVANMTNSNINASLIQCPIPANLAATDSLGDRVEIAWESVSHPDFLGYDLYRSNWEAGDYAKLNSSLLTETTFTDSTALDSMIYWYYATASYSIPDSQVESLISNKDAGSLHIYTGTTDDGSLIPDVFFLADNVPNPFNPSTTISFGLPEDSDVRIEIFNLLGQKVKTLMNGPQRAGFKRVVWNGDDQSGKSVSSGVYFYRLLTDDGSFERSKKMMLLK
jgi:hypothetical protein